MKKINRRLALSLIGLGGVGCTMPISLRQLKLTSAQYTELRDYIDIVMLSFNDKLRLEDRELINSILQKMDAQAVTGEVDVVEVLANSGIEILATREISKLNDKQLTNAALAVKGIKIIINRYVSANPAIGKVNSILNIIFAALEKELNNRNSSIQNIESVVVTD
jgi:hypothetical protein